MRGLSQGKGGLCAALGRKAWGLRAQASDAFPRPEAFSGPRDQTFIKS